MLKETKRIDLDFVTRDLFFREKRIDHTDTAVDLAVFEIFRVERFAAKFQCGGGADKPDSRVHG